MAHCPTIPCLGSQLGKRVSLALTHVSCLICQMVCYAYVLSQLLERCCLLPPSHRAEKPPDCLQHQVPVSKRSWCCAQIMCMSAWSKHYQAIRTCSALNNQVPTNGICFGSRRVHLCWWNRLQGYLVHKQWDNALNFG